MQTYEEDLRAQLSLGPEDEEVIDDDDDNWDTRSDDQEEIIKR